MGLRSVCSDPFVAVFVLLNQWIKDTFISCRNRTCSVRLCETGTLIELWCCVFCAPYHFFRTLRSIQWHLRLRIPRLPSRIPFCLADHVRRPRIPFSHPNLRDDRLCCYPYSQHVHEMSWTIGTFLHLVRKRYYENETSLILLSIQRLYFGYSFFYWLKPYLEWAFTTYISLCTYSLH